MNTPFATVMSFATDREVTVVSTSGPSVGAWGPPQRPVTLLTVTTSVQTVTKPVSIRPVWDTTADVAQGGLELTVT
ncbi:hypothetical protein MAR_037104 [Mya arenaria]|uniref:Uncharacterized protein n=1 Tax=Mya arenaria TaxID=6604 RepID=A0ABY7FML1_MYAAR|nr:hypothetical protein MAR_037104 [Mya arenaria]